MASPGMEVYNVPDQGLAHMSPSQGTESNQKLTAQVEQFETMYHEGATDYFVDQGFYYPTATNYGYICTGFEPASDWEDHHRIFGLDGQDIQQTGAANESLPFVYYTPGYTYGQSLYNPYNPYIPGAMVGVDGSIVAPQQYYGLPSYESSVTSPTYVPFIPQSRTDNVANGIAESFIDNSIPVNKIDGIVAKSNVSTSASNAPMTAVEDASSRRNSSARVFEGNRVNTGSGKQNVPSTTSGSFMSQTSSLTSLVKGPPGTRKISSGGSQLKSTFAFGNGLSGSESSGHAHASVHKVNPKILNERFPDDVRNNPDTLSDQYRGPKMDKPKNQFVVKAYTTMAENLDEQGNIIISTDNYNKVDFPVNYKNAKFFVIKSYSEDDVHKSIKYNVWSSTPNGNKKLNAAYEDAQRIAAGDSRGCPTFLFFSVNASGQFCGVAEMTGPVDFHRDMDFWQQDKWSGSFPVKWHIIKDLPNHNFRHIILESNENKPVTNSRDTQEICYKKGLEMLQIFKNYSLKTSLLDDFLFYENRQRNLQEERARLVMKSYENPYNVSLQEPPRRLQPVHEFPAVNGTKHDKNWTVVNKNKVSSEKELDCSRMDQLSGGHTRKISAEDQEQNMVDELKVSKLTIHSNEAESAFSKMSSELVNVVTIGSMPVKVTTADSCGILTVGTILLDPQALGRDY